MADIKSMLCDGCGQVASAGHIARRLQRLEWSTRFRPVHISTLLLGAAAPGEDAHFLYSPASTWEGEARLLLEAVGENPTGKSFETILAEFQRAGFFLTHVLECPLEDATAGNIATLIENRLAGTLTRIRRSLKPKRLAPISRSLGAFLSQFSSDLCPVLLDNGVPFALDADPEAARRLRSALIMPGAVRLGASPGSAA